MAVPTTLFISPPLLLQSASFCDCTNCGLSSGTCKAKRADNEACNLADDDECQSGSCETTGFAEYHCKPAGGFADGHQCDGDDDCKSSSYCDCTTCGVKSGKCTAKRQDNDACNLGDDDECLSGNCEGTAFGVSHCKPSGGFANGFQCNEDADCQVMLDGKKANVSSPVGFSI
jgi:hypothetical protein